MTIVCNAASDLGRRHLIQKGSPQPPFEIPFQSGFLLFVKGVGNGDRVAATALKLENGLKLVGGKLLLFTKSDYGHTAGRMTLAQR